MRILHVIESIAPRYGGPVSVVNGLASAQAQLGHHVEICTTNSDYPRGILRPAGSSSSTDGMTVHCFPVQFSPLQVSLPMRAFLRSNIAAFDIVHIHGLYRFPPTYAGYLSRTLKIPYIVRPFGALDPVLHGKSARSLALKRIYEWCFDRPSLNAAGAIHYTTRDEQRRAAHLRFHAPSFVLPNGLDWRLFDQLPERGSWRHRLGIGDRPLVLFVGRLHPVKGLEILLDAFAQLRSTLREARLLIVGPSNDAYGQQLRTSVARSVHSGSVHFVGQLDGTALLCAYVDADVYALPSYSENFGMTVAEAMACGLPVVISDQVKIQNEVADAGAGVITRCDAPEVELALRSLLGDDEARRAMGAAGRALVRERFVWERLAGQLDKEYRRVIATAGLVERGT